MRVPSGAPFGRFVQAAVPQTALIPIVTGRYSSVLMNFAAHSPEDSQANATGYVRDCSLHVVTPGSDNDLGPSNTPCGWVVRDESDAPQDRQLGIRVGIREGAGTARSG